jgi:hypothetical protein
MNFRRYFILTYFHGRYGFHKITRTGAFGPHGAEVLPDPIQTNGNALKSALIKHHVKQFHESSCSVASIVSAINAIREQQAENHTPIDQKEILEKVNTAHWKERMTEEGYKGRRGLPLSVLGEVVKSSLAAYGISYRTLETVQTLKDSPQTETLKSVLWQRLSDFETKGNCVIIAHFDQGTYVPTLNIPHISPIGGVDTHDGSVTMLDVDPDQEKPYRISFDTFYKGISADYNRVLSKYGYAGGGYIYIQLH